MISNAKSSLVILLHSGVSKGDSETQREGSEGEAREGACWDRERRRPWDPEGREGAARLGEDLTQAPSLSSGMVKEGGIRTLRVGEGPASGPAEPEAQDPSRRDPPSQGGSGLGLRDSEREWHQESEPGSG